MIFSRFGEPLKVLAYCGKHRGSRMTLPVLPNISYLRNLAKRRKTAVFSGVS